MKISLKALRVNADLTQAEVAERMKVNRATVLNWENYITSPTAEQLVKLCAIYGCSLGDIFLPDRLAKS